MNAKAPNGGEREAWRMPTRRGARSQHADPFLTSEDGRGRTPRQWFEPHSIGAMPDCFVGVLDFKGFGLWVSGFEFGVSGFGFRTPEEGHENVGRIVDLASVSVPPVRQDCPAVVRLVREFIDYKTSMITNSLFY